MILRLRFILLVGLLCLLVGAEDWEDEPSTNVYRIRGATKGACNYMEIHRRTPIRAIFYSDKTPEITFISHRVPGRIKAEYSVGAALSTGVERLRQSEIYGHARRVTLNVETLSVLESPPGLHDCCRVITQSVISIWLATHPAYGVTVDDTSTSMSCFTKGDMNEYCEPERLDYKPPSFVQFKDCEPEVRWSQ
ncbi:uncharacterized protein L969DRAFT_24845, partial [Mixia osmundae IAM 14324]|uniref:uncharacterized protein n=1 Tax=Mixia osmundae (strain CBS 9802 / IAM 14324 / JCM 22182 / KY 12970) TaxID=764103 RepID=UPI0004A5504D